MTKKTAIITTVLAAIGLTVLALPATAQETDNEAWPHAACVQHGDAPMPYEAMQAWMGELAPGDFEQMHDRMRSMMATMHDTNAGHGESSMPGPQSMTGSGHMGAQTMMGGTNPWSMMRNGS